MVTEEFVKELEAKAAIEDITITILEFFGQYFDLDEEQGCIVEMYQTENLYLTDFVSDDVKRELYDLSQNTELNWSRGLSFDSIFESETQSDKPGSIENRCKANKVLWEYLIIKPIAATVSELEF